MKKPKPKFRVGQVVAFRGNGEPIKVGQVCWLSDLPSWCYWPRHNNNGYIPEKYLRAITARERGPK